MQSSMPPVQVNCYHAPCACRVRALPARRSVHTPRPDPYHLLFSQQQHTCTFTPWSRRTSRTRHVRTHTLPRYVCSTAAPQLHAHGQAFTSLPGLKLSCPDYLDPGTQHSSFPCQPWQASSSTASLVQTPNPNPTSSLNISLTPRKSWHTPTQRPCPGPQTCRTQRCAHRPSPRCWV